MRALPLPGCSGSFDLQADGGGIGGNGDGSGGGGEGARGAGRALLKRRCEGGSGLAGSGGESLPRWGGVICARLFAREK